MTLRAAILGVLLSTNVLACDYHNLSEKEIDRIASVIYICEGGKNARVPYGILSVKVKNEEDARRICKNTIRNNFKRWLASDKKKCFIQFLGFRYAPIGAENDPRNLNSNWVKNVHKGLTNK